MAKKSIDIIIAEIALCHDQFNLNHCEGCALGRGLCGLITNLNKQQQMRFTKRIFPILYNSIDSHYGKEHDFFVKTHKSIRDSKANVYYLSASLMNDAGQNWDKIHDEHIRPGMYVLLHKVVTCVVSVGYYNSLKDNHCYIAFFAGGRLAMSALIDNSICKPNYVDASIVNTMTSAEFIHEFTMFLCSLSFIQHADVKQKVCPPKGKCDLFHCKYKSDVDIKIQICDESWYTECLQCHKFIVRSHWRWQPCGIRSQDRKLIKIGIYEKQGYKKGAMIQGNAKQRKQKKVFGASGKPKNI